MKKFKHFINSYSLEIRILILAGLGGLLLGGISSIINIVLKLGLTPVLITFAAMGISLLTLYFAFIKKIYKGPSYSVILFLILVLYPLLWFFNGGSQGPTMLFMIFNAILSAVLLSKYKFSIVILLTQILVTYLLLFIELRYPSLITFYETATIRSFDIGFSFLIVFLTTFALVSLIMKEYNKSILSLEKAQLELKTINDKLTIISEVDDLTELYNRRHVLNELAEKISFPSKESQIGVIMFDIDHFKKINDTYGHGTGDLVLKKISEVLKKNVRQDDIVGRIGGEEFLIIMPEISKTALIAKAEKLRELVADLEWENDKIHTTISGGVYLVSDEDTLDEVLEQVDLRLYRSKNEGRNRISYDLG